MHRFLPFIVAIFVAGCNQMQASPVAPSATIPPVPIASTAPPPTTPSFAISIATNGGQAFTDSPWSTSVTVSGRTAPTRVNVNCNNDAPLQEYTGAIGSLVITCAFSSAATYTVVATALGSDGYSATDRTVVVASVRPPLPPSLPPPTPSSPYVLQAARAAVVDGISETWTFSFAGGLTSYHWTFDDGTTATTNGSTTVHTYTAKNGYHVTVTADKPDGTSVSASRDITVTLIKPS